MKAVVIALVIAAGCGGTIPPTRFYDLAPAKPATAAATTAPVLALEPFDTDQGYDDDRIVYRTNPYRFDYYEYHRWNAPPGVLVGRFLARALVRTGAFAQVVHTPVGDGGVVLSGRVIAIEEVDRATGPWLGHVVLELRLADAATGAVLWSQQFDETAAMPTRSPEGVARAVSTALDRIARSIAAPVREIAVEHDAAAKAQASR